ncbi:hypothetical protein M271_24275 [Streptomyces rapamycinicus NRRL 5491]|nr:hypothetical protein M271_24275 [Streptomyces rapamycinicus NRRL 5491]
MEPALGGSGLLVALGLAEVAHDWDLTVDSPEDAVREALAEGGFRFSDRTGGDRLYATRRRFVIDGGDHSIDLLVGFALRSTDEVVPLPTRVTGAWRELPLADPVVWERAYVLLGRPGKAAALRQWLNDEPRREPMSHMDRLLQGSSGGSWAEPGPDRGEGRPVP